MLRTELERLFKTEDSLCIEEETFKDLDFSDLRFFDVTFVGCTFVRCVMPKESEDEMTIEAIVLTSLERFAENNPEICQNLAPEKAVRSVLAALEAGQIVQAIFGREATVENIAVTALTAACKVLVPFGDQVFHDEIQECVN